MLTISDNISFWGKDVWLNGICEMSEKFFKKSTLRDCKCNFKWPFIQRWQCPIYNGTLESFVDQAWIRYQCFCFFKLFIFICGFFLIVTCEFLVIRSNGATHEFRLRFQRYLCKSDIAILAWKVTWNYAYSPFNIFKNYDDDAVNCTGRRLINTLGCWLWWYFSH